MNDDTNENNLDIAPSPLQIYWGGYQYSHQGACNNVERGPGGCTNGCWKYFCPYCGLGSNRLY